MIAFTYTTPWDNYLVAREVWWYGPDRVIATIGYVPIEEYAFFILQPILTGLFTFQYLARRDDPPTTPSAAGMWGGALLFGGLSVLGVVLLWTDIEHGLYLGLILAWACPLLMGMWVYDGKTLWTHRKVLLYTIGIPTLYLWIADAIAIHSGIWTIAGDYTVGIALFGLPLEEATFFLLTNCLVVKGILLLLFGTHDSLKGLQHHHSSVSSAP
jgi:lycopene cyclase domain-containing protein